MNTNQPDKGDIFNAAADLKDPAERAAYLDRACGADSRLRSEIEDLLAHDERAGSFLDAPPTGVDATLDACPIAERPGTQFGRYKLLQEIGEGGMGTVFMAEQLEPVKRRVALKIIKEGMDTRQFIARFEAERQALALMDHPNIARVLDAGCTETGRPYFVMELVKGIPITKFCDENRLTARERLELFVSVCHAVQHAHQKGIIHRDLKPSNVLVALYDDRPVPKIIDFGVAKATNQQLTEKTLFTQIGQIVGTWEYMSPEQAVLNQLDVDTRTDIYSLGVILYELLTGVTPLERDRLRSAAFDEMLRLIREEEPPKPSTRVSSLGETATATAAYRGTNAASLTKTLRGDLDWIVMKALEKNRSRRYETASGLGADLKRYLGGEPVEARPPSTVYRLRKAAARHRVALVATAIAVFTLIAFAVTSTWLAVRATREARRAWAAEREYRRVLAGLWEELADRALDAAFSGNYSDAEEAIRKAELAGAPEDLTQTLRGVALFFGGQTQKAIDQLEHAVAANPDSLCAVSALYWAYMHAGAYGKMDKVRRTILRQNSTPNTPYEDLFQCMIMYVNGSKAELGTMIDRLSRLIERRGHWGVAYAIRANTRMEYGMETMNLQDFQDAIADFEKAESILPNSPFVQTVGLYVLTTAIELAEAQGTDAAQWRNRARQVANRFLERPAYVAGMVESAVVYYHAGDTARAMRLEDELVKRGVCEWSPWWALLFEKREMSRLESELRSAGEDWDAQICLALLLAEKSAEGREQALEVFKRLNTFQLPVSYQVIALDIAFLSGDANCAREPIQRILASDFVSKDWRWYRYITEYYAGQREEGELLRHAGPFSNAGSMANYAIAIKSLARGEREKAKKHFERTVATKRVGWSMYHWARAFLQRMEEDPAWPAWIPPHKTE